MTMTYWNNWYTQDYGAWVDKEKFFNKRENAEKWAKDNAEQFTFKAKWGDEEFVKVPKFKFEEIVTED